MTQKAESFFISNRIRLKLGLAVLQMKAPIDGVALLISICSSVRWLPASPPSAYDVIALLYALQFLIDSTFMLRQHRVLSTRTNDAIVQRWVIERSRCQLHGHGTPCRLPSELHRHSPRSGRNSNKHFSCNLFLTMTVCLYSAPVTVI